MTMTRLLALLLCAACLAGCSYLRLWHRVDRDVLDMVPNEEKLLLFDAENGVYIAKDEIEIAQRQILDAERALDRAERYQDVIDERKTSGAAIDTPAVLSLLASWNDARIAMREQEVSVAEQRRETADARVWASRARYERAKALLVKDHVPEEGTDIDISSFDEQVADAEADETEEQNKLKDLEEELSRLRATYDELSSRLQTESKGAYGGPWADLVD